MNNKHSILIVDDESNVRDSLSKWFREDGYEIGTAENAQTALRRLQEKKWDVILLDIKMPGMDGMELQQRIRDTGTGSDHHHHHRLRLRGHGGAGAEAGAFDYITKPVDPDDLSHLVRNAIEQRAALGRKRQAEGAHHGISPGSTTSSASRRRCRRSSS